MRLLVSHPATESKPLYSPDGRRLAFMSTRTGNGDIYILNLDSGELKRLTFDDGNEQLDAWSADGKWIYFSSSSRDISGMNDIFRVNVEGGTPMQVSAERYVTEHFSAPSPDGNAIAFTGHGFGLSQWWRKDHSHIDESEGGAKEVWPMWSNSGRSLYYVSDRNGAQNIWKQDVAKGSKAEPVTRFTDGRVLWPNISYAVFCLKKKNDFQIWKLDT